MQNKEKNITIVDVAKKTGVSIATISRIINGGTGFSKETEKKVWNVIHELGYEPSRQARVMRNGKSPERLKNNLIMRIVNSGNSIEDDVPADTACSMAYFNLLAQKKGLFTTNYLYNSLSGFRCPLLLDKIVDGAIVCGPHKEVIEYVAQKVPTVLMDVGSSPLFPELIRVNNAMSDGIGLLLYQAYELGHRSAAVVGAPDYKDNFSRNHCSVICRVIEESPVLLSPGHCYRPVGLNPENHDQKMKEVVRAMIPEIKEGKFSLIVCEDASYSFSVYDELVSAGIRIPEQVSVVSLNTQIQPDQKREITSVLINWKALMETAIEVLQNLIAGKQVVCREYLIQPVIFAGKTLAKKPEL